MASYHGPCQEEREIAAIDVTKQSPFSSKGNGREEQRGG